MNEKNDRAKVFELGPVKSPEEVVQEGIRKIAPEVRRAVYSVRISMAAKGFFCALLEYTFLHCYGGSGKGKIFISIKDLARLLRCNKDSITAWRDTLRRERLIWVRESWPKSEWRICALCPAPVSDFNGREDDYIRGRAETVKEQSVNLPLGAPPDGKPAFGPNPETSSDTKRKDSASPSEGVGQSLRRIPPVRPTEPVGLAGFTGDPCGNLPPDSPKDSALLAGSVGETVRNLPPDSPKASAGLADGFRSNKETPRRLGVLEASKDALSVQRADGRPGRPVAPPQKNPFNALKRKGNPENAYLDEVRWILATWSVKGADEEMRNSGAWWRGRHRKNPQLAEKVLAEIAVMIKEGTIATNPGAAAVDLWKRWNGGVM